MLQNVGEGRESDAQTVVGHEGRVECVLHVRWRVIDMLLQCGSYADSLALREPLSEPPTSMQPPIH